MTYRITITPRAEADIERHYSWLARRDWGRPDLWYKSYLNALARVRSHPQTCGLAFESDAFPENVHHLLFGPKNRKYRAFFTIRDDAIILLAIRGPGERPATPPDLDDLP